MIMLTVLVASTLAEKLFYFKDMLTDKQYGLLIREDGMHLFTVADKQTGVCNTEQSKTKLTGVPEVEGGNNVTKVSLNYGTQKLQVSEPEQFFCFDNNNEPENTESLTLQQFSDRIKTRTRKSTKKMKKLHHK
jgi:hypothetical protein